MGMYVLPQRESSLESYLRDWMSRNQQEKMVAEERAYRTQQDESERATRSRERQSMSEAQAEQQRSASIAEQFRNLTPAQQKEVWPTLPPQVQAALISPTSYAEDPGETTRRSYAGQAATTDPATASREMKDSILHNLVVGRNPSGEVTQTGVRREETTPEQFTAGTRAGFDLPTPGEQQRLPSQIAADKALADKRRRAPAAGTGKAGKPDTFVYDEEIKNANMELRGLRASWAKAVDEDRPQILGQIAAVEKRKQQAVADRAKLLGGQAQQPAAQSATEGRPATLAPQADVEYITQDEYDALIEDGETPESIAADGLAVR